MKQSNKSVDCVSALVFRSHDPERLAAFYRDHLGIPFELQHHGTWPAHPEAWVHGIHFAVLRPTRAERMLAPTFRVRALDDHIERLASQGVSALRRPLQLADNMRVASFRDNDDNTFNLIEVDAHEVG